MSSGFVKESDLDEVRKKRQEEWEKVRQQDDPQEAPEEPYDHRSLFERLQEQKKKKDFEYEEAHKLKNMIKGLDDDEVDFLEKVDLRKIAMEQKKSLEDIKELEDFRQRVASLQSKQQHDRLLASKSSNSSVLKQNTASSRKHSQQQLLRSAVKPKKCKMSQGDDDDNVNVNNNVNVNANDVEKRGKGPGASMTCIGILPGLGCYNSSSDSESSSDEEVEPRDLLGRSLKKKEDEQSEGTVAAP